MRKFRAFAALLLATSFAAPPSVRAQEAADPAAESARIERVAALGRLWSLVKFFHPYLAHRDIDWDGAFVAAVPKVNAAAGADEYAAAVQGMLDALGDSTTRVRRKSSPRPAPASEDRLPVGKLRDDGIFVVTVSDYEGLVDFAGVDARFRQMLAGMDMASGVVFDVRSAAPPSEEARGMLSVAFGTIERLLSTTRISAPGKRTRMHVGFAPQFGATSGDYYSAESTAAGAGFGPSGRKKDVPISFLANEFSELPPVALALQSAGKAAIVAEGAVGDASVVSSCKFDLPLGVTAEVRLSELAYDDGTDGFRPDAVVDVSDLRGDDNPAFQRAIAFARQGGLVPRTRGPAPPRGAPQVERQYAETDYPAPGLRVLAAVRIWSTLHYFHPYLELVGEDWDAVLPAFIPRMEAAKDATEYALAVAEMVAHIHDSHGFVSGKALNEYFGAVRPPVRLRIIEGAPVVTGYYDEAAGRKAGVEVGDVVESIDGEPWRTWFDRIAKYVASSTPQALDDAVAWRLLCGADGSSVKLTLRGAGDRAKEATLTRAPLRDWTAAKAQRTGKVFEVLPGGIGYADLDRLPVSDVDAMFDAFKETKAIVFDMRGYPSGTAWAIAPRLAVRKAAPAAVFRCPVLLGPGPQEAAAGDDRAWSLFTQRLPVSDKPRYEGRTVMLIDGRTQSQAEHTGLFFESANGTKFVGSPTAGANGDVTNFYVPGGIRVLFTGQAVTHADGRRLQRLGLQPDVEARPTIAGVRARRDEVLEKALEYLAGAETKK